MHTDTHERSHTHTYIHTHALTDKHVHTHSHTHTKPKPRYICMLSKRAPALVHKHAHITHTHADTGTDTAPRHTHTHIRFTAHCQTFQQQKKTSSEKKGNARGFPCRACTLPSASRSTRTFPPGGRTDSARTRRGSRLHPPGSVANKNTCTPSDTQASERNYRILFMKVLMNLFFPLNSTK